VIVVAGETQVLEAVEEGIYVMTGVRRAASHEVRVCGRDVMGEGGGEVRGEPWRCRGRRVGGRGGGGWGQAWPGGEVGEVVGSDMGHGEVA